MTTGDRDLEAITLGTEVAVPPATLWHCLTDPAEMRRWWGLPVTLEPIPGGRFEEVWRDGAGRRIVTRGTVLQAEAPALLELTWADEDWTCETRLRLALNGSGDATRLELRHDGWRNFPAPQGADLRQAHLAGWQRHLRSLKTHAEAIAKARARDAKTGYPGKNQGGPP